MMFFCPFIHALRDIGTLEVLFVLETVEAAAIHLMWSGHTTPESLGNALILAATFAAGAHWVVNTVFSHQETEIWNGIQNL